MVVGQDWGDVAWFKRAAGQNTGTSPTDRALIQLLGSIGLEIPLPRESRGRGSLFFTNAILCLKGGGAQGAVQREWFQNCGARFLRPLIDLVRSRVVVCLGEKAYHAVLAAYNLKSGAFRGAVEAREPARLNEGTVAFAVYHCGARIQNTHRPLEVQLRDWKRIEAYLARPAGSTP
jgi:uracil-DNA glycosylase